MNCSEELQNQLDNGSSLEEALLYLRKNDKTPIETIKAIKEVKNIGLGEAKELFASSNAWKDVAKETDKMHQELIDENEKNF